MKRVLAIVLVAAMLLSFAACGNKKESSEKSSISV